MLSEGLIKCSANVFYLLTQLFCRLSGNRRGLLSKYFLCVMNAWNWYRSAKNAWRTFFTFLSSNDTQTQWFTKILWDISYIKPSVSSFIYFLYFLALFFLVRMLISLCKCQEIVLFCNGNICIYIICFIACVINEFKRT